MAVVYGSSSSSSSTSCNPVKHDVFLSFRGEDTRAKFTSHLHAKLIQKSIETYIDNRLSKGDEISPALIEAIKRSRISVIIFSENYATSSWCLDEVVCILKCKKEHGQIVVPVFYDVDPSHVRKQLKSYETAFAKHEQRWKERMEKVDDWRAALTEVSSMAGWDSQNYNGTESELVEAIVKDILMKLNRTSTRSYDLIDLVGIDKSIEEMERLLCIDGTPNVRIVGIWGMGGLGKTTLARAIFQRFSSKFQGCCFLANVKEESGKPGGLDSLNKKLFSELLEENDLDPTTFFAKERLRRRKVFIVLDDVDDLEQLEVLAADHHWFGAESRIIITTRDAQVLRDRADEIYQLKGLVFDDALHLFILNAFKRNPPTDDEVTLSKRVVTYADGNPLALKVLGSFLRSRRRENWEIELKKLEEVPNQRIHNILKISFDGLDETEKAIFLDIVCFFGMESMICRKLVERRLGAHRCYVNMGIDSLIDKSLISVKEDSTLVIHDLLTEMGWEIERRQCKRTRLWRLEHLYHVFKDNTGSQGAVEGISCFINKDKDWSATMFEEMHRLWLLNLFGPCLEDFPQDVQYLPDSLTCLMWYPCTWKSLPPSFVPHNLVELRMPQSMLERLWSGVQNLPNLKYVDLSRSYYLTEVSALSQAPNLVSVDLSSCGRLRQVPSLSFQNCEQSDHKCKLVECQTLGHLKLDYCKNLKVVEKMRGNVKELHLSSTSVVELPSSICSLENLEYLNLSKSHFLQSLPSEIQKLKSLKRLDLSGCCSLDRLPVLPRNLIELNLRGTSIKQLPSTSMEHLSSVKEVSLADCVMPKQFEHLENLDLDGTEIKVLPSMSCFSSLKKLCLDRSNIKQIPLDIKKLTTLIELLIRDCVMLKSLPELPLSLKYLDARRCFLLSALSNSKDVLIQGLRSGSHVVTYRKFVYADCLSLDRENTRNNIVREFQLRSLDTSIKSVRPHSGLKKSDCPGVCICCPGYEIPMWFTYQSKSSSINFKLSSNWLNTNFLGFALCAVVEEDISFLELSCEAIFKTNYDKSCTFHWDCTHSTTCDQTPDVFFVSTSNVFMWYKNESYHDCLDTVEVSFHFYDKRRGNKVRACGIRLLYLQDAEEYYKYTGAVN